MRKVWMLAISGPCAVNNPPEYLLQAIRRPVVRFSGTGAAMPCHQSKRYSGGMRSAHGVQRANVGSSQLSGFDCFQASSRMHQSTVHCALDLVVGGVHYETFAVPTGRSRKFSRHPESRKPDTWPGFDQVVGWGQCIGMSPAATRCMVRPTVQRNP